MLEPTPDASSFPDASRLVDLLRHGDAQAGALLNDLFRAALIRFCWGYLGNLEEAEDAVQEVCLKVLRASEVPDALRPWIYKIARNHCFNIRRGQIRRKETSPPTTDAQAQATWTGQLTRLVRAERRNQLADLVQSLPEAQREALRLRYVEGLHRHEIAAILEIPESVVKSRLFEAVKRLRELGTQLADS